MYWNSERCCLLNQYGHNNYKQIIKKYDCQLKNKFIVFQNLGSFSWLRVEKILNFGLRSTVNRQTSATVKTKFRNFVRNRSSLYANFQTSTINLGGKYTGFSYLLIPDNLR